MLSELIFLQLKNDDTEMRTMENGIRIDGRSNTILSNNLGLQTFSKYDPSPLTRYLDVDSDIDEDITGLSIDLVTKKKKGIKALITEIFSNRSLNFNHSFQKYLYPRFDEE